MKEHNPLSRHPRIMPLGILALILGPAILYVVLRSTGVPAALVSGVVLLVAAKHLGLLAMIVAPFYALVRRRAQHKKPGHGDTVNRGPADQQEREVGN